MEVSWFPAVSFEAASEDAWAVVWSLEDEPHPAHRDALTAAVKSIAIVFFIIEFLLIDCFNSMICFLWLVMNCVGKGLVLSALQAARRLQVLAVNLTWGRSTAIHLETGPSKEQKNVPITVIP